MVAGAFAPVRAADAPPPSYWFSGTRLILERPEMRAGEIAVASDDGGIVRVLTKVGATLAFDPKQRYVVITTADRRSITFTVGDPRFTAGTIAMSAPFAPYLEGGSVYLPLTALARALYLDPVAEADANETVLQPQIAWLDARSDGRVTVVTIRGATPLRFKRAPDAGDGKLSLVFLGSGSTLEPERSFGGAALRSIAVSVAGTPRNPATTLAFDIPPGTVVALAPSRSPNEISIAFAPAGTQLGGTPLPQAGDATSALAPLSVHDPRAAPSGPAGRGGTSELPNPPASDEYAAAATGQAGGAASASQSQAPPAQPGAAQMPPAASPSALAPSDVPPPAQLTAIDATPFGQGLNLRLTLTGSAGYEWHRLPDDRWYVDLKNVQLALAEQPAPLNDTSVTALRVKQLTTDPIPVVRVALSLASPRQVDLVPFDGGLTLAVNPQDDATLQKVGYGQIGTGPVVSAAVPVPAESPAAVAPGWKFAGPAVLNPKLIVIDPGHGGSDDGAVHNGLREKDLTLDIARRLRALLLARGWQVKMTRDSDVDVFGVDASAHDELQARCDVANEAGARLFVSVHINSFTSSSLNGTTTYYYKGADLPLAQAIHRRLIDALGTKDDGVRKENFYVIHHTSMPATLIETAFISNPDDAALLRSPEFLQKVAASIADGIGDYASGNAPDISGGS